MKNNIKKKTIILLCLWMIVLSLVPLISTQVKNNLVRSNKTYISSDFNIKNYDVILDVDKDNKVDVTESITVDIPDDNYNGIYRSIPLYQKYYNQDSVLLEKKIQITNLRVIGEKFERDTHLDRIGIQIGSRKVSVNKGSYTYHIKYRYNMGKDDNSNYDEFVFNLFDNYDDTKISNMHVLVNMPKKFNDNIYFMKDGQDITDKVNYQINDKSLEINLNNYLLDNSITLVMSLDDHYFVGGTNNYGYISFFVCILIILISLFSIMVFKKYSQNTIRRVQTVELYAPDGLDAAQVGYIYGEDNIKKLTTALIIQLASKKYISIEEVSSKRFKILNIGKGNETLDKLSITEELVYQELFKKDDINFISENSSFVSVFPKIRSCLENITDQKINDRITKNMMSKLFLLLLASIITWMITYLFIRDLNPKYNILYLLSFISIFITGIFIILMRQKTDYGEIIKSRILGFRSYLLTAEKDILNGMVDKNPNYFYDILPYTYVLGISDKWISNFDNSMVTINLDDLSNYEDNLFIQL